MGKLFFVIFTVLFILSCKPKKSLEDQLNESFSNHLRKIDSSATIDSVHILWKTAVTQKLGAVIDDSVYMREFVRIQGQLLKARQKNEKDSIDFFKYEINYMKKEIDSVTKSILLADSTHNFGILLNCAYYITKNQKTKTDSTFIFLDPTSTLRYTEFMDSAIRRTIQGMN
jgi:hypothetical protein